MRWGDQIAPLRCEGQWYRLGKVRKGVDHHILDSGHVLSLRRQDGAMPGDSLRLQLEQDGWFRRAKKATVKGWVPAELAVMGDLALVLAAEYPNLAEPEPNRDGYPTLG